MLERKIKPIAVAVGTVFAATLTAAAMAEPESDLFAADELDRGYERLADAHGGEGSCGEGEGSCGEDEGKCGEGSCGEDDGDEGKCGEGKCGEEDGGEA